MLWGVLTNKGSSGHLRQKLAVLARSPRLPCGWIRHPAPVRSNTGLICRFVLVSLPHDVSALKVVFHLDRKSTRLNSSHSQISYAVFCLKKKKIDDKSSRRRRRVNDAQKEVAN